MKVIKSLSDWKLIRSQFSENKTLGFVPTMGCLHAGHMSLVSQAKQDNDIVLMSVFVNAAQFNNAADFNAYPITLERDEALAEEGGVDYLFLPDSGELYPDQFNYQVIHKAADQLMEGRYRPGHFSGVLTVVLKLLLLVRPHHAYFGEKDYQQLQMVRGLVEAFLLEVEVVGCPTVREENGLAMSSRNARLSKEQCEKASLLFQMLSSALSCSEVEAALVGAGFDVEYIEEHDGRRFAAASLGGVRLIDNVLIEERG